MIWLQNMSAFSPFIALASWRGRDPGLFGFTWAICTPGALISIGGSGDIDVQIIIEQALKDAPRFAGFDVEDQVSKTPAQMARCLKQGSGLLPMRMMVAP